MPQQLVAVKDCRGACYPAPAPRAVMLKLLKIKNIAVISGVELEFGGGLTALTGETGAGKSILIDALGLLLGARASPELIRTGEEQAVVEALVESAGAAGVLDAHGLPSEDGDDHPAARDPRVGQGPRERERRAGPGVGAARPRALGGDHPRPARPAGTARRRHPSRGPRSQRRAHRGRGARSPRPIAACARSKARCARSARTAARRSGSGSRSRTRSKRSIAPRSCRGRRTRSGRRRRCRPTRGGWPRSPPRRTACCTTPRTRSCPASARSTGSSRTSAASTSGSRRSWRPASPCARSSRTSPSSSATTRRRSTSRRDGSTRSRAGWR